MRAVMEPLHDEPRARDVLDRLLPGAATDVTAFDVATGKEIWRTPRTDVPTRSTLVTSRSSLTVIERPQARFLERYHVELAKLGANDESLLNDILREHTPPQLDEDLSRARSCIQEITVALEKDLARVDPTLVPTVSSTRGKLLHHLKDLESKALRAVKRKNDTVRNQFLSTRTALYPGFSMQERKLSPVGFVNKHGWHFSKMIEEAANPQVKSHLLFYI